MWGVEINKMKEVRVEVGLNRSVKKMVCLVKKKSSRNVMCLNRLDKRSEGRSGIKQKLERDSVLDKKKLRGI